MRSGHTTNYESSSQHALKGGADSSLRIHRRKHSPSSQNTTKEGFKQSLKAALTPGSSGTVASQVVKKLNSEIVGLSHLDESIMDSSSKESTSIGVAHSDSEQAPNVVNDGPQNTEDSYDRDFKVPYLLRQGTPMLKVSAKKVKTLIFTLDADQGLLRWDSRKPDGGKILIENIKEFRPAASARSYRLQLKVAEYFEPRWLTIIYTLPSSATSTSSSDSYKVLHVVALTSDIFTLWLSTLTRLHNLRTSLLSPSTSSSLDERERIWERSVWRSADVGAKEKEGLLAKLQGSQIGKGDDRLSFEEVRNLCKKLGVGLGRQSLDPLFKMVDTDRTGYLNFPQFRKFVKLLKARPEIERLYRHVVCSMDNSRPETSHPALELKLSYPIFLSFIRSTQKVSQSSLPDEKVKELWDTLVTPSQRSTSETEATDVKIEEFLTLEGFNAFLMSSWNSAWWDSEALPLLPRPRGPPAITTTPPTPTPSTSLTSKFSPDTPVNSDPALKSVRADVSEASAEPSNDNIACTPNLVASNTPLRTLGTTQDMTRPLSEYYISSSHNTYLIGHQLVGVSTIEGYIRALLAGCRSVELDIYDSSSNPNEPIVKHGKTLTSSVPVRTICQAIAKYAFVASPYPIIISAEIHCGLEGQEYVAKIMKETFGDALIRAELKDGEFVVVNPPAPAIPLDRGGRVIHPAPSEQKESTANVKVEGGVEGGVIKVDTLPSPEDLKGRVLLKAKNLYVSASTGLQQKNITVDTESSVTTTSTGTATESDGDTISNIKELKSDIKLELSKAREMVKKVRLRGRSISKDRDGATSASAPAGSTNPTVVESASSSADPKKVKMALTLCALLVYTVGVKCRGFNKKETYAASHVFSLSERTANKVLKQSMYDLIKHNRGHVVRIYPDGMRIGSTNYEPVRYWGAGCQLVAINWQTFDLGYILNHAMFQRNAKAGYVLKPLALRSNDKSLLMKKSKHLLRVTIISGQQLPCPPQKSNGATPDPYVEVSLHAPDYASLLMSPSSSPTSSGPSSTATVSCLKTSVVKNNSFNPIWEETLAIPFEVTGDMKELVFVRFEVKDPEKGGMGVFCASLACLREGYRHLPLHDSQLSQYLFSTLFVRIDLEDVHQ